MSRRVDATDQAACRGGHGVLGCRGDGVLGCRGATGCSAAGGPRGARLPERHQGYVAAGRPVVVAAGGGHGVRGRRRGHGVRGCGGRGQYPRVGRQWSTKPNEGWSRHVTVTRTSRPMRQSLSRALAESTSRSPSASAFSVASRSPPPPSSSPFAEAEVAAPAASGVA